MEVRYLFVVKDAVVTFTFEPLRRELDILVFEASQPRQVTAVFFGFPALQAKIF
jgi:hypothetical protein